MAVFHFVVMLELSVKEEEKLRIVFVEFVLESRVVGPNCGVHTFGVLG